MNLTEEELVERCARAVHLWALEGAMGSLEAEDLTSEPDDDDRQLSRVVLRAAGLIDD